MDGIVLPLLESGIARVVTREEAARETFDYILGGEENAHSLSEPSRRFEAAERVLQSWRDRLPSLPIPGVSLCQRCEDIDVEVLKSSAGYKHSEDYWRLAASAGECPMCALMVGALRGAYFPGGDFDTAMKLNHPLRTDLAILLRTQAGHDADENHEIATIRVEMTNMAPVIPAGRLCVFALPDSPAARCGLRQRLGPNDTEKFAIISDWVRLLRSPDLPRVPPALPATPQEYPRRLIDVGAAPASLDADVRLVEKSALASQSVEYIALSYRWGVPDNWKTTTKRTLADHQKGIPVQSLPQTLRDAVAVTRRLSIQYLWIDSLCIIQDDKTDWATEARYMGDIYMNSALTIAAHAAEHANHGFLEQALERPKVVPVGGGRNGGSYDAERDAYATFQQINTGDNTGKEEPGENGPTSCLDSNTFFVAEGSNSHVHLDTSELASRGWVLQERILSQKTIHFCRNGAIYLKTNGALLDVNERLDGPRYYHEYPGLSKALRSFYDGRTGQNNLTDTASATSVRQDWYSLVAHYSTRLLTEPDDKLVAISGIARKLQPILNDEYYCGIWARHFHTNLLWLRRSDRLTPSTFSARARAPSWSWAAHDGAIQFPIWSHEGPDTFVKPEIRLGMVLGNHHHHHHRRHNENPLPQDNNNNRHNDRHNNSIFDGWAMLELRRAVRIGTGLRFRAAQTGKPQWQLVVNSVTLSHQTRFWGVASDAGDYIGWAALDWEARDEVDGDAERITCFRVASFGNDRPENGFKRGVLVLFVKVVDGALGIFGRVGMGQILDASLFDERDLSTRHERLLLV